MPPAKSEQENPIVNVLVNVLIPVLALSFLSKDPALQEQLGKTARFWHIGPLYAMLLALSVPIGYGIWFFVRHRKGNLFSGLGMVSVLLTGGLTLYLWNPDGSVKDHAGILFGIKEASIPLVLGVAILLSRRTPTPLLNVFLYNDSLFDIPKIEKQVKALGEVPAYERLIDRSTHLFATSFFISSVMNLGLATWFFRGFNHQAADALEVYNSIIARLTGWGFLVIGVPILIFLFLTLRYLLKGLGRITGWKDEDLMMPR